ncbi:uncharacterized protein LOC134275543 [Saccostrea cucullata]|uniref:uncharacterized protein LOC134275543 n=1 Tax=Saccostrea cuccullata TaxID=36930 RepID=UPI002ED35C66
MLAACIPCTSSTYNFHPWMNGGASRRPTKQDREVVKNMTEWIQNDTIRFYVQTYLLFCPGQDMCFGEQYRRNYTAVLPFTSCSHCECGYECKRKKNCCPWRNYKQDVELTPDYITYKDNDQFTPSKYIDIPQQCVTSQVNDKRLTRSIDAFFMVSQCPYNYTDSDTHLRCENSSQITDLDLYQPVFSLFSNESFKNLDCAICNGESLSSLVPWRQVIVCSSRKALLQTQSLDQIQSTVFHKNTLCNVIFVPQTSTFAKDCFPEKQYVSNCNETGQWKNFDSIIFNACHADFVDVYLECISAFERNLYKNIFCAMCNVPDWNNSLGIECVSSGEIFDLKSPFSLVSFSALIDFRENGDVSAPSEGTKCSKDSLYEPYIDECIPIVCEEGMKIEKSQCIPILSTITLSNYEINFLFIPTSNHSSSQKDTGTLLRIFIENFISLNSLKNHLCSFSILYYPNEKLWRTQFYYWAVVIKLSVSTWHKYRDFIYLLNKRLDKIDGSITSNLVVRHVGQTFSGYFEKEGMVPYFRNPMTKDIMIMRNEWVDTGVSTHTDSNKVVSCLSPSSLHDTTIIAAWSICPRIIIDKRKIHVLILNFTLYFLDFDFYIDSKYFHESDDKSTVLVCVEQYRVKRNISAPIIDENTEEKYLSLVCTIISSSGCIGTLVANTCIQNSNSPFKYNTIALSFTLLLANLAYSLSKISSFYPSLCLFVGGLTQFLWLGVVNLMCMSCFSIFRAFTSWTIKRPSTSPILHRLANVACSFLIPLVMTLVNVLVSRFVYMDNNFGYSLLTCYLSHPYLNLCTFSIPIAVMVLPGFWDSYIRFFSSKYYLSFILSLLEVKRVDVVLFGCTTPVCQRPKELMR